MEVVSVAQNRFQISMSGVEILLLLLLRRRLWGLYYQYVEEGVTGRAPINEWRRDLRTANSLLTVEGMPWLVAGVGV